MHRAWFIAFALVAVMVAAPLFVSVPAAAQAPSITIVSPKGITPVSTLGFQIEVTVSDFILDQENYAGVNIPGHGHIHYYLDPTATSDGTLVAATWLTFVNVGSILGGPHTVRAELRNNNHAPLSPRIMQNITVTAAAPSITIVSPKVTAVSTLGLRMEVSVAGLELDDANYGGTPIPGHGHIHYYLDPTPTSDGTLVAATTSVIRDIPALTPGTHILRAELRQNNHAALSPRIMQNITVTAAAPLITIVSPKVATVPILGFRLEVRVAGLILDEANYGGTPVTGQGLIHYYLDPTPTSSGALMAATTATVFNVPALTAGVHTIRAELRQNNHAALTPAVFQDLSVTAAGPSIALVAPKTTSVSTLGMRIEVAVAGLFLDPDNYGGTNVAGHGHIHYTVDGTLVSATTATFVDVGPLTSGNHVIRVELRNNDHSALSPAVFQEITVTAGEPTIDILEPVANSAVSNLGFRMRVRVGHLTLDPENYGGALVAGRGHVHFYVDNTFVAAVAAESFTFTGVTAGTHTVRAELANNDHSLLSPAVFEEVSVVVQTPAVSVSLSATTSEVGQPVAVSWTVSGFVIDSSAVGGAPEVGRGHVHIFVDDQYRAFSTGDTFVVADLAQGGHTIRVGLFNNDHTELAPPVGDSATVQVVAPAPLPSQAAPLFYGTVIGLVVVIAILATLLVVRARRRKGPPEGPMIESPPK